MFFFRTFRLGLKSLLLHPMRSMLTMLGIMIGVTSVIWLLAFGEGISHEAKRQYEDLGAENIMVRSIEPPQSSDSDFWSVEMYGVSRAEQRLLNTIPTVDLVMPIRELPKEFTYTGNPNIRPVNGRLVGCTPDYLEMTRLEIERGHFITHREMETNDAVCVIAGDLAQTLFPSEDPLNKQIFLPEDKERYTIVGVLKPRSATAAIGGSLASQDFSKDIYIPISTMRARMGDIVSKRSAGSFSRKYFELTQVTLRVRDIDDVPRTAQLVENTLKRNDDNRQDIAVIAPYELLKQAENARLMILGFMFLIAGISLLVGGIGIMNIMLATVTERTREIGIRRALGANRQHIIAQFLTETAVLSIVGGLVGVLIGFLFPPFFFATRWLLERFFTEQFESLPPAIQIMDPNIMWTSMWVSVPSAFCVAVAVGIVFGVYPAIRAAQMDPIEALRHE